MTTIYANSKSATEAYALIRNLQARFADKLELVGGAAKREVFGVVEWLRDGGRHGGGTRRVAPDGGIYNRASVNISQVHYDDLPEKPLGSASAISSIVHPVNPHAPSMHMHISWTELKSGKGYWRLMADLNPSLENNAARDTFRNCMKSVAPEQYAEASAQGDRYFFIPALGRHRGVNHFYLEDYKSDDPVADFNLAKKFGEAVIDCYTTLIGELLRAHPTFTPGEKATQLAYHTLYLFQVLTLDRGTTSGLMVHDQNDQGIMGSLPAFVDRDLLQSWKSKVAPPQDQLVQDLAAALTNVNPCPVDAEEKQKLAAAVREHYRRHPEALSLQASGNVIPPTIDNHSKR